MVNQKNIVLRIKELELNIENYCESYDSDSSLLTKELEQLIYDEVNKFPKNVKLVFQKSRNEYKSIKEIATEMSLSEQTVKNNISIALHRLRLKFK